jgi:polyphosphate kinase
MADINRIFKLLENPKTGTNPLKLCKTLIVCPIMMRKELIALINKEIKNARAKKSASITLKLNSLSDHALIQKLYLAAQAGVQIKLIIRSIFCGTIHNKKIKRNLSAISIVDEYLEHARILIFGNDGHPKVYISSADWMVRNLDHRVEAAVPVLDKHIQKELKDIINIQLEDNVKARLLDDQSANAYVPSKGKKKVRSQIEIYHYLNKKNEKLSETSSH